ncbi:MAG TPA: hypothetical protein VF179_09075 [Thermoanaerobaculia bacterium]|nr:hypothetical protein [Thermoanaerobaculia bacterium]
MRKAFIALTLAGSLAAGPTALLDQFWSFVASVLSEPSADEGCGLDPDGRCKPAPQMDGGLGFDPDGQPGS